MPTRQITVTVTGFGATTGPLYNISDDVLGLLASGVTRSQLISGYNVFSDSNSTKITVTSTGVCTNSLDIILATPTPTPTPLPGPTFTPTPTPTPTPVPVGFDPNYSGFSNICGEGGKAWTRLIGPVGTTVELSLNGFQFITSTTSGTSVCIYGGLYQTSLPSVAPVTGPLIADISATINVSSLPYYLTNADTTTITIPGEGYRDLLLVYTTKNIGSNFSNGRFSATITAINSSPISGGDLIYTWYACSDSGVC
jgi:hypothetical protein